MILAVVGPPHSGKTVFLSEVYRYLLVKREIRFFLQRAAPDGEGIWSAESDQELVKQIRHKYEYTDEFVNHIITSINSLSKNFQLVLIDCGGMITEENRQIISNCTHFVIISSNRDAMATWLNFCEEICECECVGIFDSLLTSDRSPFFNKETLLGLLVGLDRSGVPKETSLVIEQFTNFIISLL